MDRIQKPLKAVLSQVSRGDMRGLDVKKLRGRDDIFRVRKGNFRIIYRDKRGDILVLAVERRSERTYRSGL